MAAGAALALTAPGRPANKRALNEALGWDAGSRLGALSLDARPFPEPPAVRFYGRLVWPGET